MNFSEFSGYSSCLDNLSPSIKKSLSSIVFCKRENDFSVCAITYQKEIINEILTFSPPEIVFKNNSNRWGVDLESLKANKIRIYSSLPKQYKIRMYGYYLDESHKILEEKRYTSLSKTELSIDRYDKNGNLISSNELEAECSKEEWTGPSGIISKANQYGYDFVCMKKLLKNQTYLILHNKI